jgi:hypothetical protein
LIRCHRLSLSAREDAPLDRIDLADFLRPLRLGGRLGCALFWDGGGCTVPAFSDKFRLSAGGNGFDGVFFFMFAFLVWVEKPEGHRCPSGLGVMAAEGGRYFELMTRYL